MSQAMAETCSYVNRPARSCAWHRAAIRDAIRFRQRAVGNLVFSSDSLTVETCRMRR